MSGPAVCVRPRGERSWVGDAVTAGGGLVVDPDEAEAVIWTSATDPDGLSALLADHPGIRWVQLPFAGIEPYVDVLDVDRTWTCGKGVYAAPVAELALALLLSGLRHIGPYARAGRWTPPAGTNLLGARVTVLGGGGITRDLLRLLAPFDVDVTVVRRHPDPLPGARRVVGRDALHGALTGADGVVAALALTPETRGVIGVDELALLPAHAGLVNVARGGHVDTDALVAAFAADALGSAGLDVTDPEPLPDDHPLWSEPRCTITPHVANTPEMGRPLLAARIRTNVARWVRHEDLLGLVDVAAGY